MNATVWAEVVKKYPKTSFMEGQLILREAYDQAFGIFNHTLQAQLEAASTKQEMKKPLSSVAYHHAEDVSGANAASQVVSLFVQLKIHERFGLSLTQYLDLPRELANEVKLQAQAAITRDQRHQEKTDQVLNDAAKSLD